jgi:light-regulated signal transduction histidine kinase (bacteriophytochrome)
MSDGGTAEIGVDFSACEHEPIHLAGSIQPHGFLLAVDEAAGRIVQVSENIGVMLGLDVGAVLGKSIDAVLGEDAARRVRAASENPQFSAGAMLIDRWRTSVEGEARLFALLGHRHGGHVIIEGECLDKDAEVSPVDVNHPLQALLGQVEAARGVDELLRLVAREVRRLSGFDRALVYRFDPDWNGQVIAEDRNDALPSYLHQHFPASDVPKQARELYRLNRLRLIASADYEPVKLCGSPGADTRPLDLSLSTLRSVSPVHREYMRNMGTGASFSISLIRDGELWGLISCHHREPRRLAFGVRMACGLLAQVLSLQLAVREQTEGMEQRMRLQRILTPMVATLRGALRQRARGGARPRAGGLAQPKGRGGDRRDIRARGGIPRRKLVCPGRKRPAGSSDFARATQLGAVVPARSGGNHHLERGPGEVRHDHGGRRAAPASAQEFRSVA